MNKVSKSAPISHKNNNLDFMRLLFAILVIFSHSFALLNTGEIKNSTEPLYIFSNSQTTFGTVAVSFFFIISGFLITQSWLNSKNSFDYLWKRVLRIYPAFIVVSLLCAIILVPMVSKLSLLNSLKPEIIKDLAFLNYSRVIGAFSNNPYPYAVNGATWTIKYEFGCYLLIVALGLLGILKNKKLVLFAFIIFFALFILNVITRFAKFPLPFENSMLSYYTGTFEDYLSFGSLFLSGSIFFYYRDKIPFSSKFAFPAFVLLFFTGITGGFNIALVIFGSYLVFYFGFHPRIKFHNFSKKGDFSYGTYLYAFPIQQLLIFCIGLSSLNPIVLFLLATPLTLIMAMLSWYFVEKPSLKLKNLGKLINKKEFQQEISEPKITSAP